MFKEVSGNRFFIGALAFFILCVGGSRLYQWHVLKETKNSFADLVGAEVLEAKEPEKPRVRKLVVAPVIAPVLDASQEEQPSAEVAPVVPVTRTVNYTRNSDIKWKNASEQRQYNRDAGNPPPYENLPVDLWDFEATKAAMIENINFVKANWDPKTYFDKDLGREMRIAYARATNIHSAAMSLGIYTREQTREINALYFSSDGFTNTIRNAADEMLKEQGVE